MVIVFRRRQNGTAQNGTTQTGGAARPPRRDPAALPQHILDRHGARILHPTSAATYAGAPKPNSTVYRGEILQIRNSVFRGPQPVMDWIDSTLAGAGYQLANGPADALEQSLPDGLRPYLGFLPDMHRRVRLEVAPGASAQPVDA